MRASTPRARKLRREASNAADKLWDALRNRGLRGCKFRREHPILQYFADFACIERRVVVEVDGGQHDTAGARRYDARRTRDLEAAGWHVMRFWNTELDDDHNFEAVLNDIGDALERGSR